MKIITDPKTIEEESMRIIEQVVELHAFSPGEKAVVKRVIHSAGDPSLAGLMRFHPRALECGVAALRSGCIILTDVSMVKSGLSRKPLALLGVEVRCLIDHPAVAEMAREKGITRAMAAMELGASVADGGIIAIGNAPTALFALCRLIAGGKAKPALVVATPVGFVGAAEAKRELMALDVPYITVTGTRGGSPMAAAIVNALLFMVCTGGTTHA
ncbi:precorrin-8X methylmutase [Desulfovirgula thermocuniculi]|uniref:precorrin-8X methylmutase n=1 Tax=Desulfovirgula thermocuniculi TaxID=348842 RepID=UPI00042A430D|nr:precorrin-8X methylmutase [Desulfovirgula thermocuniculi]